MFVHRHNAASRSSSIPTYPAINQAEVYSPEKRRRRTASQLIADPPQHQVVLSDTQSAPSRSTAAERTAAEDPTQCLVVQGDGHQAQSLLVVATETTPQEAPTVGSLEILAETATTLQEVEDSLETNSLDVNNTAVSPESATPAKVGRFSSVNVTQRTNCPPSTSRRNLAFKDTQSTSATSSVPVGSKRHF
ncbi:uncharacterized protein LOC132197642 isoform X3 [Neocloeon triangulifer]|uniref:uncharacterized protein LOC132197642 isoform X3 n=1 Tax=Neocloeon triangulifer TaxID=2078957 RepID=UPI00286F13C3|nr:uncharacterized protein LOC132197642 isoform X3 [Neocloeon triangulifer]